MKLQPIHRAGRFFRSLTAGAPSPEATAWAECHLSVGEQRAFARLGPGDRSHSIGVAKAVEANLGDEGDWVITAALLHDIGKSVPGLGTYGRVIATICGALVGQDMADHWAEKSGMTRRIGLYLKYPVLGVDILELAGSDERVIAWSAEHHLSEEEWTIPLEAGRLLKAADDGRL
ncbi:MAG TPA: HD domain-containing protein [Microthrixaceae bacterium]|nr:HD domain-containing protein [Microthrixaceae bacterium]